MEKKNTSQTGGWKTGFSKQGYHLQLYADVYIPEI